MSAGTDPQTVDRRRRGRRLKEEPTPCASRSRRRQQDRGPPRGRGPVRGQGCRRAGGQRPRQAEALRPVHGPAHGLAEGVRAAGRRRQTIEFFDRCRGKDNGAQIVQADLPGRALHDTPGLRGDHDGSGRRSRLTRGPRSDGRAATTRGTRPRASMGGGHKRRYRTIDFRRDKLGIPARSRRSSTTRTARRASPCWSTRTARSATSWRPTGLEVGAQVVSGPKADIVPGNALPLQERSRSAPRFTTSSSSRGKGGQLVRSAGPAAQLMAKEGELRALRLPSGEIRKVHATCCATVGQVGNIEHENVSIGKAGRNRWLGWRPAQSAASAMNPVDHPHGGGEGKTSGGRHPASPWG